MTKLLYIAAPYRAKTIEGIVENIRRANDLAKLALEEMPHFTPIVPHNLYALWDGLKPDEWFLSATMEVLRRCDAVAVDYRWSDSKGTVAELEEARKRKMPIYFCACEGFLPVRLVWKEGNWALKEVRR